MDGVSPTTVVRFVAVLHLRMALPRRNRLLFEVVVVDFDAEDNQRTDGGDYVCYYQWPVCQGDALYYKEDRAEAEHTECRQGNAVGVAGAYGSNGLRQVAEYHANTCGVAYYAYPKSVHGAV